MRSRLLILIVALLLGGLAALMAGRYLHEARTSIEAEESPVEVFVAKEDIPRGLYAEELVERDLVELQEIPRRYVAGDAVSSIRAIEGQVLANALSAGEQLSRNRFKFSSEAGLAYTVPEGHVAISIRSDEIRGVAGLIKPGDQVMILVTLYTDPELTSDYRTKILLPRVRVLAVGRSLGVEDTQQSEGGGPLSGGESESAAQPVTNVTLAVSPADAERLVFAEEEGRVWLALIGPGETAIPKTSGQTVESVME